MDEDVEGDALHSGILKTILTNDLHVSAVVASRHLIWDLSGFITSAP